MAVSIYKFVILLLLINTAAGIYTQESIQNGAYDSSVLGNLDQSGTNLAGTIDQTDDNKAYNTDLPITTVGSASQSGRTITKIVAGINPFSIHPFNQTSMFGKVFATIILIIRIIIDIITPIKIYNLFWNKDSA